MRHKLTIGVGEDFITRISVDGQPVGLIQKLEFIVLVELDKHQQDIINLLKEIPWLKVDALPVTK